MTKALLVGDIMLDEYVYGNSERISPEAPVAILQIDRRKSNLGGAGTVLRNLSALGIWTHLVTVIGNDNAGVEVTRLVSQMDNVVPTIVTEAGRRTTLKTRHISGHHHLARADYEDCKIINQHTQNQIIAAIKHDIKLCDVVILSDYGKGALTEKSTSNNISLEIIGIAREHNKPVIVDPKKGNFSVYAGATVITPNLAELSLAYGHTVSEQQDVVEAGEQLIEPVDNMLITRGKDGMTLIDKLGTVLHIPAAAREVYDVTGAGDTVVAVLAAALAEKMPLADACKLANKAAGIAVGRMGTATVTRGELHWL